MPKSERRKGKKARNKNQINVVDEDDTGSIVSDVTEISDTVNSDGEKDEKVVEEDNFEDKFKDVMDRALDKSTAVRVKALDALKSALQKRIISDFLMNNCLTLTDIVERSLKKGKGAEQVGAAKLASVFVISIIGTDEAEEVFKNLSVILTTLVCDASIAAQARKECASTLAMIAFIACPEGVDRQATLNTLHNAFAASLPKGNGLLPTLSPAIIAFHAACLQGICLLLTLMSVSTVYTMAPKFIEELLPVLTTPDTELRILIGEAMALIYEIAREHDNRFYFKRQKVLLEKLDEFVSESHKYHAKKDRKMQRASFRAIIESIKDGELFTETVMVGHSYGRQELILSCWQLRMQYGSFCHALEQGLDMHMTNNATLRDVFDLGPPVVKTPSKVGMQGGREQKRPNHQTPEVKARILQRRKNRDNRNAAAEYDDEE